MCMSDRSPFTRSHVSTEEGTSLMELIIAMAAGLIVLGATLQGMTYFQQYYSEQQEKVVRHQDLRLAFDLLEQELRIAGSGSISIAAPEEVQFLANIHDLITTVTTTATVGQTSLSVEDGRGWGVGKTVLLCAGEPCETLTLARDGQRSLLSVIAPLTHTVPVGASLSVVNRVRYYTRRDDRGFMQLMRMVDGGASVLAGDIQHVRFSYWDERGQRTTSLQQITRVVVEVVARGETIRYVRDIGVQS
jgi:hypothetical protein